MILKIIENLKENKQKSPSPTTTRKLHRTFLVILVEALEVIVVYKVMEESKLLYL